MIKSIFKILWFNIKEFFIFIYEDFSRDLNVLKKLADRADLDAAKSDEKSDKESDEPGLFTSEDVKKTFMLDREFWRENKYLFLLIALAFLAGYYYAAGSLQNACMEFINNNLVDDKLYNFTQFFNNISK